MRPASCWLLLRLRARCNSVERAREHNNSQVVLACKLARATTSQSVVARICARSLARFRATRNKRTSDDDTRLECYAYARFLQLSHRSRRCLCSESHPFQFLRCVSANATATATTTASSLATCVSYAYNSTPMQMATAPTEPKLACNREPASRC